jgi:hypothetical protein
MFENPPFEQFATSKLGVFSSFLADADDGIDDQYGFERRPLYVETNPPGGQSFRVLGLHLKSKDIFRVQEWSKWWQIADANRRNCRGGVAHLLGRLELDSQHRLRLRGRGEEAPL